MRNLSLKELVVQIAVHLVEEIAYTAVEDDVQARLDKMGHVYDSVVLPVFRMLLNGSKALCNVPVLRKRTKVHSARHAADRAEQILMSDCKIKGTVASHGIAGDGSALSVCKSLEVLVNVSEKFLAYEGLILILRHDRRVKIPAAEASVRDHHHDIITVSEASYMTVVSPPVYVVVTISMKDIHHRIVFAIFISIRSYHSSRNILLHGYAEDLHLLLLISRSKMAEPQQPCHHYKLFNHILKVLLNL